MGQSMALKCTKNHYIRPGKNDDTSVKSNARKGPPSYVLMCDNQQVGAMMGRAGLIFLFEIFEPFRELKHSEIFLELLEAEARREGKKRIKMVSPTNNPAMIAAFERGGYTLEKEEENGNRWYFKDL